MVDTPPSWASGPIARPELEGLEEQNQRGIRGERVRSQTDSCETAASLAARRLVIGLRP